MTDNLAENREERFEECYQVIQSFEYFLDNYVYIEDKISKEAIDLELWPEQRKKIKILFSERLIIILKAHQLGYTWIFVAAYALWKAITEPLHHIVINSFNEEVGVEILRRVDFIMDRLPSWMIPPIGKSNTQLKEFLHFDDKGKTLPSVIQVIPATEKGAQSKTPTILIVDESAQNRYVEKAYAASKPGIDMAQGQIIIISNSIKDAPGWPFTRKIYTDSMKEANTFARVFLSWTANPLRPSNFREIQLNEGLYPEDFSQRYPETEAEAISTMLGSYFGNTLKRHIYTTEGKTGHFKRNKYNEVEFMPDPEDKKGKRIGPPGIVTIWKYPYHLLKQWDGVFWEKRYAIGSDISEGLGQTDSIAYVMDRISDELICQIRSNRIDAYEWAQQLYMASQYYKSADKDAIICPERTGAGITTCKRLLKLNANLYMKLIPGKIGEKPHKEVGWSQSEKTKHELCGDLKNWLRTTKGIVYSGLLIEQCSTYIRHDTGKLDPEEGKYGDAVIGAGCTLQAGFFLGGKPVAIPEPVTGWLEKWQKGTL